MWSPQGDAIAFSSAVGLRVAEIAPDLSVDVAVVGPPTARGPAWSADGSTLTFASNVTGAFDLYTVARDGSDLTRLTGMFLPDEASDPAWVPAAP